MIRNFVIRNFVPVPKENCSYWSKGFGSVPYTYGQRKPGGRGKQVPCRTPKGLIFGNINNPCIGSESGLNLDLIGSADPDPGKPEQKKLKNFMFEESERPL